MSARSRAVEARKLYLVVGAQKPGRGIIFDLQEGVATPEEALQAFLRSEADKPEGEGWVLRAIPIGGVEVMRPAIEEFLIACGTPPGPGVLPREYEQFVLSLGAIFRTLENEARTGIPITQSRWGRKK